MMSKRIHLFYTLIFVFLISVLLTTTTYAQQSEKTDSLDSLLENIKQSANESDSINREREKRFIDEKSQRKSLLNKAKIELNKEKQRTNTLKRNFDKNEKSITNLENKLHQRMGSLGELIGVYKQIAGDTAGVLEQSRISAQFDGRVDQMKDLAKSKALPSIQDLEALWFALQQEMT